MTNKDYQKEYKKSYNDKNKIITFPLSVAFYDELKKRATYLDLKTNSYSKSIITTFLNNSTPKILSYEQKEFINDYIRISRGIANNINQIAHKTNMKEQIDINILINSLKIYEEEFKKFITKE
jgi:hypothetical protein